MAALTVWKRDREGWIKFAVNDAGRAATKGRLYIHVPHVRPGVMDASVWGDLAPTALCSASTVPPWRLRLSARSHRSVRFICPGPESPSTVAAR